MEAKDLLRGDRGATGGACLLDVASQRRHPLRERASEALLLGRQPHVDRLGVLAQLRVGAAHQLAHALAVARQEARVQLQAAALLDRSAHHPAQHVAAVLVGGHHAVSEEEGHRAGVVREDAQPAVGIEVLAVAPAGELLSQLDQGLELVCLEHRPLALEDRRQAVQAEARVDVVGRQRLQQRAGAVGARLLVVLHEHQVPILQEALVLLTGEILRAAVLDAAVHVQLRARAARAAGARLPEVLRARAGHDPLAWDAQLQPLLDRLLVRAEPEAVVALKHRHPDVLLVEPEDVPRKLPRERDGLALEVVPEGEVAEHLKEGQVACGVADVVDVHRAKDLLTAGEARSGRGLLAEEVGLQRMHARNREQRGGVVRGGHQRGGGYALMPALLKEAQVALAYLVRGHRARRS